MYRHPFSLIYSFQDQLGAHSLSALVVLGGRRFGSTTILDVRVYIEGFIYSKGRSYKTYILTRHDARGDHVASGLSSSR